MPSSAVNFKHLAETEYAILTKGATLARSTADVEELRSATQKLVRATLQQEYAKHPEERE
jgi:hypothetical protein